MALSPYYILTEMTFFEAIFIGGNFLQTLFKEAQTVGASVCALLTCAPFGFGRKKRKKRGNG